jgi:hypothetical protein
MDLNIYQQLYKEKLTREELLEANSNLIGFIELLIEIDKEQKKDDRYNSVNNPKR